MNVKNKFKPSPNIRLMDQVRAVIRDGFTSEQIAIGLKITSCFLPVMMLKFARHVNSALALNEKSGDGFTFIHSTGGD